MDSEIDIAWQQATSIPPGDGHRGEYIGSKTVNNRVYDFYKENGVYKYESHTKGGKGY